MPYTWERIKGDWIGGGKLAADRADVVRAFELVEEQLGPDWMESA